jgi:hypothetical protein
VVCPPSSNIPRGGHPLSWALGMTAVVTMVDEESVE